MSTLRAKIRINWVSREFDKEGNQVSERVTGNAVYSDDPESENKQWSQWTPAFNLDMTITNPAAFDSVKSGEEFYLHFIPADVSV
jgi:hypothetical protein